MWAGKDPVDTLRRDGDGSWHRGDPLCDTLELLEDCYPELEEQRSILQQLAYLEEKDWRARASVADFAYDSILHARSPVAEEKADAERDKVMEDDSLYEMWNRAACFKRIGHSRPSAKGRRANLRAVLR